MANTRVGLVRRVKTDAGRRYFPEACAANGHVKPDEAIVAGTEVKHPTGYLALRFCEGSKLQLESLSGITPVGSVARRKKNEAQLSVTKAKKADVQVVPPDPKRNILPDQLAQFVADALGCSAGEAAEANKRAGDEFLANTDIEYVVSAG